MSDNFTGPADRIQVDILLMSFCFRNLSGTKQMSDNFTGPADRIDNRYIIHEDTLSYFLRVDLFPHNKLEGWHTDQKVN